MGQVVTLHRYPVKSMAGEDLESLELDSRGVVGDRTWAVRTPDGGLGSGKTTRRFRRVDGLLDLRARYDGGPVPRVDLPDGRVMAVDDPALPDALLILLGRELRTAPEGDVPHHDDAPLHLVTTAALRHLTTLTGHAVSVHRFRPNIVVDTDGDGFVEDGWHGRELLVGDAVLLLQDGMPRCRMVGLAQPHVGLDLDGELLRTLARVHDLDFGLRARVVRAGRIRVGDAVRLGPHRGPVATAG